MTRTRILPAAAVLVALALTGCSSEDADPPAAENSSSAPASRTVTGTLTLNDADGFTWSSETGCVGDGGYDDIHGGTQVVITDSAGATVALGKLDQGKLDGTIKGQTADQCKFTFAVPGVPTGKGFYGVEVGKRGRVQYPEQQLFSALALTLA